MCTQIVHKSITHNSQKVKTSQMSINWWANKQNVVYPYDEVLFGDKKEWSTDIFCGAGEPWKHAKCAATKVSTHPRLTA